VEKLTLPKFLDILIILDDDTNCTKIYKTTTRCTDYINRGLKYLRDKELITINENIHDARGMIITLTPKGRDTQRIVITLYNNLGLKLRK
jgi:DNA-binding MarR family transcriptional regulator